MKLGVSVALAGLLPLHRIPGLAASREPNAATPAAALSVASDPPGANVYVDGRLAGQTPLSVATLPPGDHRVRLVKDGYLENGRIVTVSPDRSTNVHVKLTRGAAADAAVAAQSSGGAGGSKKWIWIAAAGGGASAAGLYVVLRNHPPVGGSVTVTPTAVGMAGVTTFSFDSNARDEDGDPFTYDWNFGDGGRGTGKTPTHIYTATGTFEVALRVSDGKAEPVSALGVSVTVAPNVTGTWTGGGTPFFPCGINFTATQNGSVLTGSFSFTAGTVGCIRPPVTLASGSVNPLTHPGTVTWTSDTFSFSFLPGTLTIANLSLRFTGTTNTAGNSVTGTMQTLQAGGVVSTSSSTFTK